MELVSLSEKASDPISPIDLERTVVVGVLVIPKLCLSLLH